MSDKEFRVVFVSSTAGSVMKRVLENEFMRRVTHSVVVDRPCDAKAGAEEHGIPVEAYDLEHDVDQFCDHLLDHVRANEIDYVISYYTNFYAQKFRDAFRDRIVNFHPSLLPAFKGMDGFGDTIAYHAKLAGTTVELIDQVMDEGKIVMQTVCSVDTNIPVEQVRHKVFVHQCQALLQVVRWLYEDRVTVDGRKVSIERATFDDGCFSPALDFRDAIELGIELVV